MASLSALPHELFLQVTTQLEFGDKVRLSATCKEYRTQLSPEIFKTIRFGNSEALARSALAAVEAHGDHTSRIEFTCYSSPVDELTSPSLPLAASKVLEGHLTPNLRTVRLRFDFDFDDGEEWDSGVSMGTSIWVFEEPEDDDYVREQEGIWKWRALMKETWEALSANDYVRELILEDFIPKSTSTFGTDEFRQFLSRLESATLNILGLDNGACWKTNTQDGYIEFLENLDTSFFHHMSGLKHLHIQAGDPLGLSGVRYISLALKPNDLPVLHSLKLENCFVCPELVSFVQSHTQVLRSLDVKECISAGDGGAMADNSIYWARFFDGIYETKPALTEFIAGADSISFAYDGEVDSERVRGIRQRLKASPVPKLFGYEYLSDKYGSLHNNVEENVEQFINGDDLRAYDRLMGLIKENAAQQGNEHGHTG
ncbi:hypothetical protein VE03_08972 [Pseudogymnoascus sp. 23342-1-I1]|nr:hypothetical protein VE03_08972 [Pseudogymnoascus sp. 23342-1-I1]